MSNRAVGIATQIMVMAIVVSVVLLFVGIGVLVLIHICIVGRAFRRGFAATNVGERASNGGRGGLSLDDLEKLPCFDFKAIEKGSSPMDCAVCLENFKMGDKCRLLPVCKHSFHAQCVDSWLLKTPVCPICRAVADSQRDSINIFSPNHLSPVAHELRDSPTVVVGIPVSSNPSPLHTTTLASSNPSPLHAAALMNSNLLPLHTSALVSSNLSPLHVSSVSSNPSPLRNTALVSSNLSPLHPTSLNSYPSPLPTTSLD